MLLATVILAYLMVKCALLFTIGRLGCIAILDQLASILRGAKENGPLIFVLVTEELELSLPIWLLQDDPNERFEAFTFKHKNGDGDVAMKFLRIQARKYPADSRISLGNRSLLARTYRALISPYRYSRKHSV